MPNLFVECKVQSGLFKTEYVISILPDAMFYVDRDDVRVARPPVGREVVDGRVLAYLVEYKHDNAVIEMTGTPIDGGTRISVPKAMTSAAA